MMMYNVSVSKKDGRCFDGDMTYQSYKHLQSYHSQDCKVVTHLAASASLTRIA